MHQASKEKSSSLTDVVSVNFNTAHFVTSFHNIIHGKTRKRYTIYSMILLVLNKLTLVCCTPKKEQTKGSIHRKLSVKINSFTSINTHESQFDTFSN